MAGSASARILAGERSRPADQRAGSPTVTGGADHAACAAMPLSPQHSMSAAVRASVMPCSRAARSPERPGQGRRTACCRSCCARKRSDDEDFVIRAATICPTKLAQARHPLGASLHALPKAG
jgi:hypothetical protein